jgi:alanine racemase
MTSLLRDDGKKRDYADRIGVTWAEIDLDAVAHNVSAIKAHVGRRVEVIAVVKANMYGHGVVPVARTLLANGASRLAVHRLVEAIQLRQAGVAAPVLVMGYTLPAEAEAVVRWDLTPTANERGQAQALAAAARAQGRSLPVHVKVDTGMGRWGLLPEEAPAFCRWLGELPSLALEGIFTHFAVADGSGDADRAYTRRQLDAFLRVLKELEAHGVAVPLRHAANSAATLTLSQAHLDAVRPGLVLFGLRPAPDMTLPFPLQPVLTLKSRVVRLRTLPAGASIGYGCTFTTERPTRVALVPVGYGDGYHRLCSNRGEVLIHGQRAPVRGRVSMDQIVVDVSDVPQVRLHDEVVLVGRQTGPWGEAVLSAAEVAGWAETINYEVTTGLLPRVTRVYLRGGQVVAIDREMLDGDLYYPDAPAPPVQ